MTVLGRLVAGALVVALATAGATAACHAAPVCEDDDLRPDAAGCPAADAAGDTSSIAREAALARQAESGGQRDAFDAAVVVMPP
jgi:hypothetical protein